MTSKDKKVARVILNQVITNRRDVLIKGKRKFIKDNIETIKQCVPDMDDKDIAKVKITYRTALDKVYPDYPQ